MTTIRRRALYFPEARHAEVRSEAVPVPKAGEALMETVLSAVSPGTEMLIYRGQAPEGMAVDETIAALGGAFDFPIKFGYAAVGRVIALGEAVDQEWLGRQVFAFNPHESHFVAPVEVIHPLPDGISPEAAVFLPNMETAVSFLMDGRPIIGERVAVVGQGVVGLLTTALLADFPLSALLTLDNYPMRRQWSRELGASVALPPGEMQAALDALRAAGSPSGADLTFELSGNPAGLSLAIDLTGDYGRVVIGSWYGRKRVELDLGGRFHRAHMQLIGSQVSSLAPRWLGRWNKARRLDVAWEMVSRHKPERLITHRLPLERAADAYRLLDEHPEEALQVVFEYA